MMVDFFGSGTLKVTTQTLAWKFITPCLTLGPHGLRVRIVCMLAIWSGARAEFVRFECLGYGLWPSRLNNFPSSFLTEEGEVGRVECLQ